MMHVLLVENIDADAEAFVLNWEAAQFPIATFTRARNLNEAIVLLNQAQFHVVILDAGLPDLKVHNGVKKAMAEIRKISPGQRIAINSDDHSQPHCQLGEHDHGTAVIFKSDPENFHPKSFDSLNEIVRKGNAEIEKLMFLSDQLTQRVNRMETLTDRQFAELRSLINSSQYSGLLDQERLEERDSEIEEQIRDLDTKLKSLDNVKLILEYAMKLGMLLESIPWKVVGAIALSAATATGIFASHSEKLQELWEVLISRAF